MHGAKYAVVVVIGACALLIGLAGPASAHAAVVASYPADGALLNAAPTQIILKFSERVDVATAAINLETASSKLLQADGPTRWKGDPTALEVPVKKQLGGSYVVFWRATGQDTHVVSGAFSFAVQAAGDKTPLPKGLAKIIAPATTKPFVSGALTVSRGVVYTAISVLVGGIFLLIVAWPAGVAVVRMRRLLWLAFGALVVSTGGSAALSYAAATGRTVGGAFNPSLWVSAIETHFGFVAVVRLALLVLAGFLLIDLEDGVITRSEWWLVPAALVGAGLVRTPGMVDHGATASPIEAMAYFVHMASVTVWLGGLIVIVAVLLPGRAEIEDARATLLRFSAVATVALVLLAGSGVLLASPIIQHWRTVPTSVYGELFLTKLVLLSAGLTLAWQTRRWVHAASSKVGAVEIRTIAMETAFVLAVIAVTAVLVGRNPGFDTKPIQPPSITQKGPAVVIPTT